MPSIDKIRQMLQQSEAARTGKREGIVESKAVPAAIIGVVLLVIDKITIAKWRKKIDFHEGGGDIAKQRVNIRDAMFRFGKYKYASLKWLALNKPDYLHWMLDKADMFKDSEDMLNLIRAALAWAEKSGDQKQKCFGEFSQEAADMVGLKCNSGECQFYYACQSHRPVKVYAALVREFQNAAKRGEMAADEALRAAAEKHWPGIPDSKYDEYMNEAMNYVSKK
jgi:hypothetical protein